MPWRKTASPPAARWTGAGPWRCCKVSTCRKSEAAVSRFRCWSGGIRSITCKPEPRKGVRRVVRSVPFVGDLFLRRRQSALGQHGHKPLITDSPIAFVDPFLEKVERRKFAGVDLQLNPSERTDLVAAGLFRRKLGRLLQVH